MSKNEHIRKAINVEKHFLGDNPVIGGDESLKIDRWIQLMTLEMEQAESAANFQQDPDAITHILRVAAMAEMCIEQHVDEDFNPISSVTIDDVNLVMNGHPSGFADSPQGEKNEADSAATESANDTDQGRSNEGTSETLAPAQINNK